MGFLRMTALVAALVFPGLAQAAMSVRLEAPWDGNRVPRGQHCPLQGGAGATPGMQISGLPKGTVTVALAFNDLDYGPLSRNGGHGTIGFAIKGDTARLPSVPGMTNRMPAGARVLAKAKSSGQYASDGYLPPCSGGAGHRYTADVMAIGADGKVLENVTVQIGRY